MGEHAHTSPDTAAIDDAQDVTLGDVLGVLRSHFRLLILVPLAAGALAYGASYLVAPTFKAATTFMPPQQAQGTAASALASLGTLAGLTGGTLAPSNSGDRYVALMQSVTVSDRIIERFRLAEVYDDEFRVDARKSLAKHVRITLGKKDGLISVEVDDTNPRRAAEIANQYVEELRRITGTLAVTEAQQRRAFFERHLQQTRDQLTRAQQALEASGFNAGALKAEPRAAAEAYAKLRAEVTAAEVRLGLLRSTLVDGTPEIRQQQATLAALRDQLSRVEGVAHATDGPDYVSRYRQFKYQETLFDVYARQFELARVDESREGALIQVIDVATPPEKKSSPKRALISLLTALVCVIVLVAWALVRPSSRLLVKRGRRAN